MTVRFDQILASAARTLTASPGASLAEVASAAGVSRTTVFTRYRTRAALIEAVALDGIARIEEAYKSVRAENSTAPASEVLADLVSRLVPIGPNIAFLFRERSLDDNEPVQERLMALHDLDVALMQRAKVEGDLRQEASVAWLVRSLDALIFAAWEGVAAGELAALEAPRHVMSMFFAGSRTDD